MLKIIFLSAFRSLLKYKHMSIINLVGLIAGLTSFLFAVHYILFEFSYDSFFNHSENVYRVNLEVEKEGQSIFHGAKTPRALFFAIKREIPEVEANGLAYFEKCLVNYQDRTIANQDVLWVSEDFEKVFPLEMIAGIADYTRPRTGVISETCAKALYGNENPISKIMKVNEGMPIEITGIFKDLPPNTHLRAQYFIAVKTWVEMGAINAEGDWRWNGWWNYIRLKDGSSPEMTTTKINSFIQSYMGFMAEDQRSARFSLQPLKTLHFIQGMEGEMGAITNYSSLINLIVIAVITILYLEPIALIPLFIGALLNVAYEYAKGYGILGNIIFGVMISMCGLFGFYASGPMEVYFTKSRISALVLIAVLNALMTYYTYFKDYIGDKAAGKKTVIVKYGIERNKIVAIIISFLPSILFLTSYYGFQSFEIELNNTFIILGVLTIFIQVWTGYLFYKNPVGEMTYYSLVTNFRACTCGQAAIIALFSPELGMILFLCSYVFVGFLFNMHTNIKA